MRHLGAIGASGRVCVRGKGSQEWPKRSCPFSYTYEERTFYGEQRMPFNKGMLTSVKHHEKDLYYPRAGTNLTYRITSINEDGETARVLLAYDGCASVTGAVEETLLLSQLLLVSQYSSDKPPPETIASSTPANNGQPVQPATRGQGSHREMSTRRSTTRICGIAVGPLQPVYSHLIGLSAEFDNPVTLVFTHEMKPDLNLRVYANMKEISKTFIPQGFFGSRNGNLTCGVEAVNNLGFEADTDSFTLNPEQMRGFTTQDGSGDNFLHSIAGNNIAANQMFVTLTRLALSSQQAVVYDNGNGIGTATFWQQRQWAVVHIPACNGHWVAMEKINYKGQQAFCLREGRGTVMYDFITPGYPACGEEIPRNVNNKRKRA